MKEQNRPYSHNDIFLNHAKRMPKAGIQATLEKLAKDGLLVEKMYGKTAIYVVNQVSFIFSVHSAGIFLQDQFETVDEESYKQLSVENEQLREIVKVRFRPKN